MSSFLRSAIELIHRRAQEARGDDDRELVALAAHLYAVGQQILNLHGNAGIAGYSPEPPGPAATRADLLHRLTSLPLELDAEGLFQAVLDALGFLDKDFGGSEDNWLPPSTRLEPIADDDQDFLSGIVQHWLRQPSCLARERRYRYETADPGRPPSPAPTVDRHLRSLSFHWASGKLPRVFRVEPTSTSSFLFKESGPDFLKKRFRIALCPLGGDFHPCFQVHPENGSFFRANPETSMEGRESLHAHLEALCAAAQAEEVQLLVLPELTVDGPARDHLSALLKKNSSPFPYAVLAGSFHAWQAGASREWSAPPPTNEAILLDRRGLALARHRKKGRFRILSSFLDHRPVIFPGENRGAASLPTEIFEWIGYGSELQILDTSLGRLAFLICADAIVADDRGYLPLVRSLRPDLLFVVSMSHETEPFEDLAKEMSRYWVSTLLVNAHCLCRLTASPAKAAGPDKAAGKKPTRAVDLAFCDLALFEPEGQPPTRIRWPYGEGAQCRYFKPAAKEDRDWRAVEGAPTPTGVEWLGGEARLGLVIDLGAHRTLLEP